MWQIIVIKFIGEKKSFLLLQGIALNPDIYLLLKKKKMAWADNNIFQWFEKIKSRKIHCFLPPPFFFFFFLYPQFRIALHWIGILFCYAYGVWGFEQPLQWYHFVQWARHCKIVHFNVIEIILPDSWWKITWKFVCIGQLI